MFNNNSKFHFFESITGLVNGLPQFHLDIANEEFEAVRIYDAYGSKADIGFDSAKRCLVSFVNHNENTKLIREDWRTWYDRLEKIEAKEAAADKLWQSRAKAAEEAEANEDELFHLYEDLPKQAPAWAA